MLRTGDRQQRSRRALPGLTASKGQWSCVLRLPLFAWIFACFFVLLAPWQQAFGQAQTGLEQIIKPPKIQSSEPMLLQADQMVYDNDNGKITAKGNVELYYGNYTLLADNVVYDRNANTLTAIGNVRIKDPDGAVITADHITLTDDFRDGFIDALRLVTKDDTRIVAQSGSREAGNVEVFQNGWFTPCKVCEDNPDKAPTWRLRASKIIHRRDQATITFRNAWFDFFGVPMVYVPWFQMADPTVKRKSGFLMPSYSHSNELGTTVQVPYYFALSDHYDFTFAPMYTSQAGTLLHDHLAAQQVQALDAVGALVDRVEPVVAVELLDRIFPGVAVAAVHLDGVVVGQQAPLRRPRLDDRRQHVQQQLRLGGRHGITGLLLVDELGRVQDQGQAALDIGPGRQQHPAHVRVPDDRHRRGDRILAGHRAALQALAGVRQRVQVARVAQRYRTGAHADPRLVHHL